VSRSVRGPGAPWHQPRRCPGPLDRIFDACAQQSASNGPSSTAPELGLLQIKVLAEIDPFVHGLLKELPMAGSVWGDEKRKLWLSTAASIFKTIYKDDQDFGPSVESPTPPRKRQDPNVQEEDNGNDDWTTQ